MKKIRIGPKERRILSFLQEMGGSAWLSQIYDKFSRSLKYNIILSKRLAKMEQKGLIEIRYEVNPNTGKEKKRVYLKQ